MPQIKGTNVVAPVVPLDTADVHPSHEARYGKGGYRTVATLAERDAIPAPRREAGMLVYVQADDKIYQLSADLLAWEEFSGGVSTWTELEGKPSTFPPDPHGHTVSAIVGLQAALDGKQAAGSYVLTTDARLSDARQPLTHTHTASQITDFTTAVVAAAPPTTNASLLTSGTLPDARLSSSIARTADVTAAVAAVVNAAPATLDTLAELASALGSDANFSTTVTNSLASKAPLASPTFTGTVSGVTKSMVGLGNVDNTSDASKPVSTATQTALDDKAATSHTHGFLSASGDLSNASGAGTAATVAMVGIAGTPSAGKLVAATSMVGLSVSAVSNALLVTYGSTALTACQGNDSRLSDARTPTAHTQAWSTITATPTTLSGYGITDAVSSSDARLTDARTPLSHTHSAQDIQSGVIDTARLGSGSATSTTFLAGDQTWKTVTSGSTNASDLTSGTLANARMTTRARASMNIYLWSSFR
jgi:hypothetical protein